MVHITKETDLMSISSQAGKQTSFQAGIQQNKISAAAKDAKQNTKSSLALTV
jgi:hypothetical protein